MLFIPPSCHKLYHKYPGLSTGLPSGGSSGVSGEVKVLATVSSGEPDKEGGSYNTHKCSEIENRANIKRIAYGTRYNGSRSRADAHR